MLIFFTAAICTFVPPTGWEMAQLKTPSAHIQIGFLGKGSTDFRPSLSLATEEEVDVSLKEYVKAVKKLHQADPQIQWRDLGKFSTQAGEGRLTEISNPTSPWGEMKILQAMIVKEQRAYILTAAILKQELPQFQEEILKCFRSMNLLPELWTPIPDAQKREEFRTLFASLGKIENKEEASQKWQQEVASYAQLGAYWQFLALKEGLSQIGALSIHK